MIGHFFMKYKFPLAYVATKVMANHFHEAITQNSRPVRPIQLRNERPIDIGRPHTPAEKAECIRQIALVLPRVKKVHRGTE